MQELLEWRAVARLSVRDEGESEHDEERVALAHRHRRILEQLDDRVGDARVAPEGAELDGAPRDVGRSAAPERREQRHERPWRP